MKKTVSILLVAILTLAVLAGCKKPVAETAPTSSADATPTITEVPKTQEPVETEEPEAPVTVAEQEGRYIGEGATNQVGNLTVKSEWLPMQYAIWGGDRQSVYTAATKDKIYMLTGGLLSEFIVKDGILVLEKEYTDVVPRTERAEYRSLSADKDGILYLASGAHSDACALQDGKEIAYNTERARVSVLTMHPSGKWGISSWVDSSDLRKVTIADETFASEPFEELFTEMSFTNCVGISEKHIMIGGKSVESENTAIFVYDLDGKLELTLGDVASGDGRLSNIECVLETKNGYVVAGGFGDFTFFDLEGNYICKYSRDAMFGEGSFGTGFMDLSSLTLMPNGDILVGLAVSLEIDDKTGDMTLFLISGF